jgi:hypothetical protein
MIFSQTFCLIRSHHPSCSSHDPFYRSPPDFPVVEVPEDLVVNVAHALRNDINRMLHMFREIAMGHDLKKFLGVCSRLYK